MRFEKRFQTHQDYILSVLKVKKCGPVLLEPQMAVEVEIPPEFQVFL